MIEYSCCFCNQTVSSKEKTSPLDPCALILVGHFDKPNREQKEQQFFCHFECMRKAVKIDGIFHLDEPDFATNGETTADDS